MQLATFLGTGNYSRCEYSLNGVVSPPVRFVQAAVAHALGDVTRICVFGTEQARENFAGLTEDCEAIGVEADIDFTLVPRGIDPDEILDMFDILRDELVDAGPVIFDLTHGFRSQPILALLILNYLEALSDTTTVQDIVYGAFDRAASNSDATPRFPIVSLMPLWELNGWASAFSSFERHGSIDRLVEMTTEVQNREMRRLRGRAPDKPLLMTFARLLGEWRRCVELCIVPELFADNSATELLAEELDNEWNDYSKSLGRFVKPLREKMRARLKPLAADDWHTEQGLEAQLALLKMLDEEGREQTFLTLAREWLITIACRALNTPPADAEQRQKVERIVGALRVNEPEPEHARIHYVLNSSEASSADFQSVVSRVFEARNAVSHCSVGTSGGKNTRKMCGKAIESFLEGAPKFLARLRRLPGCTLFTPLGRSPASIRAAIECIQPTRVAILTSDALYDQAHDIARELGLEPDQVRVESVADPFTDLASIRSAAGRLRELESDESVFNLTGGTTALQVGIRELCLELKGREGFVVDGDDRKPSWVWVGDAASSSSSNGE